MHFLDFYGNTILGGDDSTLGLRTDLAMERHAINAQRGMDDGIVLKEEDIHGVRITVAEVINDEGKELSGLKKGVYYTADVGRLWVKSREERQAAAEAVKALLLKLMPCGQDSGVLVVGLGNKQITPDAIGPVVTEGLIISHHMKLLNKPLFDALELGDLSSIVPGVLGQTGLESTVLIKSAVEKLNPCAVIAVDALAARSVERLGTTIQLSNAGIAPGSGVNNSREELSLSTLGCPVISVGVPTVVDAHTLATDLVTGGETGELTNFFVTPKDTDIMVRVTSKTIATAINLAVHGNADIEEYAPL